MKYYLTNAGYQYINNVNYYHSPRIFCRIAFIVAENDDNIPELCGKKFRILKDLGIIKANEVFMWGGGGGSGGGFDHVHLD